MFMELNILVISDGCLKQHSVDKDQTAKWKSGPLACHNALDFYSEIKFSGLYVS